MILCHVPDASLTFTADPKTRVSYVPGTFDDRYVRLSAVRKLGTSPSPATGADAMSGGNVVAPNATCAPPADTCGLAAAEGVVAEAVPITAATTVATDVATTTDRTAVRRIDAPNKHGPYPPLGYDDAAQ